MTSENTKAEEIFHAALEMESLEQRSQLLGQACAGDLELRKKIEEWLRAYDQAGNFLEPPTAPAAVPIPESTANASLSVTRQPAGKTNHPANYETAQQFGDYQLLEELARGGMGVVYKAHQVSLNRIVALKMILAGQFANQEDVQRFYREAAAAAKLDHPGIVPIFDVGCYENQHFFSMAYVAGESLGTKLKSGPLLPRVAAVYMKKVAAAIHVAHQHGIIHRDLKPANILVSPTDEPRIVDFGLAKHIEVDSDLTSTGMVMGTPCYMPPEQASGQTSEISGASDVYSIGAILYAILTGRPPFVGTNTTETLIQVIQQEPVAPCKLMAGVPKDLEAICLKCLEKRPGDRYQTAEELSLDLQRFLAGEPIRAKDDWRRRIRKWTVREPVLAAQLVSILLLMVIIGLNYLLFGRNEFGDSLKVLKLNEAILVAWGIVAIVLQKIHNVIGNQNVIPMTWAAVNPLFLTITLWANSGGPRGELLSLYLALIVITSFFRRVDLVAITTASSLIGYMILAARFVSEDPSFSWPSYNVVFGLVLVVTGTLLGFQTLRMNRLSGKDSV